MDATDPYSCCRCHISRVHHTQTIRNLQLVLVVDYGSAMGHSCRYNLRDRRILAYRYRRCGSFRKGGLEMKSFAERLREACAPIDVEYEDITPKTGTSEDAKERRKDQIMAFATEKFLNVPGCGISGLTNSFAFTEGAEWADEHPFKGRRTRQELAAWNRAQADEVKRIISRAYPDLEDPVLFAMFLLPFHLGAEWAENNPMSK